MNEVLIEVKGRAGLVTLNRPRTLNVLSLGMIRDITAALLAWREEESIEFVALRITSAPATSSSAEFMSRIDPPSSVCISRWKAARCSAFGL